MFYNRPCSFLRKVMTRRNAVAVGFGIMAQKRAHVFVAKQFVSVGKKGMY